LALKINLKIAIIAPPYPLEEAPSPPLGVTYIAAACEQAGCEVRIFDYIVRRYTKEKLAAELDGFAPDAVGATSVTMNFKGAAAIMQDVKRHNPAIITMMGGPHVSYDWSNTLKNYPEIDIIVVGEGEETLRELLPVIRDRAAWDTVRGIVFRRDGQAHFTGVRAFIEDLDTLAIPARHLLPVSRYLAMGFPVSIITSRGCPNQCIFCLGRRMVGHKVRYRTPRLIVDEIEDIISYGFTRINIADDLFTSNKDRVQAFCAELKRRGIKIAWSAFARVNTVDTGVLTIMRDAGCDTVSFGIESGNAEMLKRVKKGITLQQAVKAVQACKESGVTAFASFMIGLPGESPETIADTSNFAQGLGIDCGIHLLAPFPGTTLREEQEKYDIEILTDDWDLYDANVPIVRTSMMSETYVADFMKAYEAPYLELWDYVVKRYEEGTCTDDEYLRVAGYNRMHLIFKLLSKDLIEHYGVFNIGDSSVHTLAERITQQTGAQPKFVESTLQQLSDAGYIKTLTDASTTRWYWTHNNRSDAAY
jgi:anaerobic magnesium-protoporphyrin IX monomethyl ester cyclase